MDGEAQPATSHISEMDTPLDHAQKDAMPLMEWALTPMGDCNKYCIHAYTVKYVVLRTVFIENKGIEEKK